MILDLTISPRQVAAVTLAIALHPFVRGAQEEGRDFSSGAHFYLVTPSDARLATLVIESHQMHTAAARLPLLTGSCYGAADLWIERNGRGLLILLEGQFTALFKAMREDIEFRGVLECGFSIDPAQCEELLPPFRSLRMDEGKKSVSPHFLSLDWLRTNANDHSPEKPLVNDLAIEDEMARTVKRLTRETRIRLQAGGDSRLGNAWEVVETAISGKSSEISSISLYLQALKRLVASVARGNLLVDEEGL